jgi:hypothetical protein
MAATMLFDGRIHKDQGEYYGDNRYMPLTDDEALLCLRRPTQGERLVMVILEGGEIPWFVAEAWVSECPCGSGTPLYYVRVSSQLAWTEIAWTEGALTRICETPEEALALLQLLREGGLRGDVFSRASTIGRQAASAAQAGDDGEVEP